MLFVEDREHLLRMLSDTAVIRVCSHDGSAFPEHVRAAGTYDCITRETVLADLMPSVTAVLNASQYKHGTGTALNATNISTARTPLEPRLDSVLAVGIGNGGLARNHAAPDHRSSRQSVNLSPLP